MAGAPVSPLQHYARWLGRAPDPGITTEVELVLQARSPTRSHALTLDPFLGRMRAACPSSMSAHHRPRLQAKACGQLRAEAPGGGVGLPPFVLPRLLRRRLRPAHQRQRSEHRRPARGTL